MRKMLLYTITFVFLMACKTHKPSSTADAASACIKKSIENFSKTECDKNPNVKEYTFQGQKVFVFDPGQCGADMTSEVFDKDCKSIGFLGGFEGNVKINGEDFSNALLVKTVWEK